MPEPWEIAWEANKYEVGRAMHSGWKRQKIANGFANHAFQVDIFDNPETATRCRKTGGPDSERCTIPRNRHHDDMIDWDDLPSEQQAINYEGGREGFRLGFEAALVWRITIRRKMEKDSLMGTPRDARERFTPWELT